MIAGVDEAGRGALAGPVVAAAVILPDRYQLDGLTDSKLLSARMRDRLFDEIREVALGIGVGVVGPRTISRINILEATMRAMRRAVSRLNPGPSIVMVDGNRCPAGVSVPVEAVVGGDRKVPCISAASVIAKVLRDRLMQRYDRRFPGYGFAEHKGYGTQQHYDFLFEKGPSGIHRLGFNLSRQETLF